MSKTIKEFVKERAEQVSNTSKNGINVDILNLAVNEYLKRDEEMNDNEKVNLSFEDIAKIVCLHNIISVYHFGPNTFRWDGSSHVKKIDPYGKQYYV